RPRSPPVAYGRWRLEEAAELGELLIVEGESDALTAWFHNVPALGIPGADMVKVLAADDVLAIDRIYIVKEPDLGGTTFVARMADRLCELGWRGSALVVTLPVKDLNELHLTAGERFADELLRAKSDARPLGEATLAPAANNTDSDASALPFSIGLGEFLLVQDPHVEPYAVGLLS